MRGLPFSGHPARFGGTAAAVLLVCVSAPIRTQADTLSPSVAGTLVCNLTSMSLAPSPALSMSVPAGITSYSVNGSGTCMEPGQTLGFQLLGSGYTDVPATCADFVSSQGTGTMTVGPNTYNDVHFYVAGPAPDSGWIVEINSTGGTGIAELSVDSVSLNACLQGGASSLDYTGTVLLASQPPG